MRPDVMRWRRLISTCSHHAPIALGSRILKRGATVYRLSVREQAVYRLLCATVSMAYSYRLAMLRCLLTRLTACFVIVCWRKRWAQPDGHESGGN
jgi:hypothetical protein